LILRVDGKPVTLTRNEYVLPKGGRIIGTSAPDGIEVQYPGGTRVTITPSFWNTHQIWHMNINVNQARAVSGIMGVIAPGNWLPALSDGTWLGPRPSSLAQRHQDLYKTFADSWRVDSTTSLFYYEAGLSPASFVVADWPVATAQGCLAPPQAGGPPVTPPVPPVIAQAEAETLCNGITDATRKSNCVTDVVATGERSFARSYLASQTLEQRPIIRPVDLVSPQDNSIQMPGGLDFHWSVAPGTELIDVDYRYCLWNSEEIYDFNKCIKLGEDNPIVDILPPAVIDKLTPAVCLFLIVLLIVIAIILLLRKRYRAALIVFILAIVLAFLCYFLHRDRPAPLTTHVSDIKPGKIYFWKVVAETKDGTTIESRTGRFEVKN
jgi:hypothetical protein